MNEAKKYPGQEKVVLDYYLKNKSAVDALKAPIFDAWRITGDCFSFAAAIIP